MQQVPETPPKSSPLLLVPTLLFISLTACTWLLTASVFAPYFDEGIYLQGGHRILNGQVPYKDFFSFTGPLIYLSQAALQGVWGSDLPSLRLLPSACIALIATSIFSLANRLAGWRSGIVASILWWGFAFCAYNRFIVNHRWLSAASLALAGILIFSPAKRTRQRHIWIGFALGLSVWATPSFAAPSAILTIYFLWQDRWSGVFVLIGQGLIGIPVAIWLQQKQALILMVQNLFWVQQNYAMANSVSYASAPPYSSVVQRIAALTGPILIPLIILSVSYLILSRKRKDLILPLLYTVGFFATSYPRWDVLQLIFVSGPAFALAAALLLPKLSIQVEPIVLGFLLLLAAYLPMGAFGALDRYTAFPSRAGKLLALPDSIEAMDKLYALVPPKSSCYIHPYLTSFYFLLQCENPTRYEFLQPGMMSTVDETAVLEDLTAHPPDTVLLQYLPPEAILETWPNSNRSTLRFLRIEQFILGHYSMREEVGSSQFRVQVWKRNP